MKKKLLHTLTALALLLPTGGAARARRPLAETLTPDERREAGEFLLRLDERWREARDFGALFDDAFVNDFDEVAREDADVLPFGQLDTSLREQLSASERRRALVTGLDFYYVAGRLNLTFDLVEKKRKAARRAAAAARAPAAGREPARGDEEDAEPSLVELLSPAVVEVFKSSPLLAGVLPEECDEGGETCETGGLEITTHAQLDELLSTLERATPRMRARVMELEAELGGAPVSAVAREDEGEGEQPELELESFETGWKNRPAGTRIVCGYVSALQACLAKEGGRYRVLAAYMLAD